ncbi:reverse transcriptase domain-containing protein [Caerostris extrusa]|uniref:Reverse transcriptase domain-containing protein n=1 Tax=Caerostris extrusa TaxID=172846 RepID=A0AAV4S6Y8_CAEEX|nr:reverse transcriptase domain-containing protein [Caerostris extrusa]
MSRVLKNSTRALPRQIRRSSGESSLQGPVRGQSIKIGLLQTGLPQGAVLSCILFNAYINDLVQKLKSIHGVKCLLYADDLIWTVTPKKNLVPLTENLLNQALTSLEKRCVENMKVNISKTYENFSLAHKKSDLSLLYGGEEFKQITSLI